MTNKIYGIGIDHGTTNSAIAIMRDDGPQIIKPTPTDNTMPSVVYIDKDRIEYVGKEARDAIRYVQPNKGDGVQTYKPNIGQNRIYTFPKSGTKKTAAQLGGMVIAKLLDLCEPHIGKSGKSGKRPTQSVITVPAMFSAADCEMTREASKLANLKKYPQIMEPVAAAIAYQLDKTQEHAQWMVFDLGGGTLDISLVVVRKGQLRVYGHVGDTQLGGSQFDQALFDYIVEELSKNYALQLLKFADEYQRARHILKALCEDGKIELSKRQEIKIEYDGELCKDDNGQPVKEIEITVTRDKYEELIAKPVERALHFCETLLKQKQLSAKDIDRIILVGGPTKTPYIKKQLSRLEIPLEDTIDPMTVVARGAAINAAWLGLASNKDNQKQQNSWRIELASLSTSAVSEIVPIRGKIIDAEENPVTEATVKIERTDGEWSSGAVPVNENGLFKVNVLLINKGKQPTLSTFKTIVSDNQGINISEVDKPQIWYPAQLPENQLANSIRVETPGGATTILVKAGEALPAKGRGQFKTTKSLALEQVLKKALEDDTWRIIVRESVPHLLGQEKEETHKDATLLIGVLVIKASEVISRMEESGLHIRDLPKGTDLEIMVEIDNSRHISVTAYIPELAEEFPASFKAGTYDISYENIAKSFENIKAELQLISDLQSYKPEAGVADILALIERLHSSEEIEKELDNARASDSEEKRQTHQLRAYKRIVELTGTIHHLKSLQQATRIEQHLKQLRQIWIVEDGKERLEQIEDAFKAYQETGDGDENSMVLKKIEADLNEVDNYVRAGPYFRLCWFDMPAIHLEDRTITPEQEALVEKANDLCQRVEKRGDTQIEAGVQQIIICLTEEDIKALSEKHELLSEAFAVSLDQWLEELDEKRKRVRMGPDTENKVF